MQTFRRILLPVAGAALAAVVVAGFTVAGVRSQQTHAPATADEAMAAAQTAQVAIAVYHMDNAGLHDLDEASAAGRIPPGALGRVRRARIVTAATQWPDSIAPKAREFVEHAQRLEAALTAENAQAAAPDAHELHELGHEISDMVYSWLASLSGTSAPPNQHP
jgi:hypothetical protein